MVRAPPVAKYKMLGKLDLSSTYCRWQQRNRREGETGLVDRRPQPTTTWNWLRQEEGQMILGLVLLVSREPDHSPREIVCWIMDRTTGIRRLAGENPPSVEVATGIRMAEWATAKG